jgi:hypothetical protein
MSFDRIQGPKIRTVAPTTNIEFWRPWIAYGGPLNACLMTYYAPSQKNIFFTDGFRSRSLHHALIVVS